MSNKEFFKNFKSTPFKDANLRGTSKSSEIILLSINATGNRLVNSRTDKSIRIWKCLPDKLADPIIVEQPHSKAVESVSWNPKHEYTFATVGRDEYIKIWKISGNACLLEREIKNTKDADKETKSICQIVRYSPDGEILAVVDRDSTILIYSTSTYLKIKEIKIQELVYAFEWFNDRHAFFIMGLHDGTSPIYQVVEQENQDLAVECKHIIKGHRSSVTSLAIDPRGKYFVIGSNEGVALVWNTSTMLNECSIGDVNEAIAHIDITRDGTYFCLTYDSGSNTKIYEYLGRDEIHTVDSSSSGSLAPSSFKWFPNKTAFVYTGDKGKVMSYLKK